MSTYNKDKADKRSSSYHHGNLRAELLSKGIQLLEETGEAGFSLRELSRRAGVTANAAYRHFANKEALLMALADEGLSRFGAVQAKAWSNTEGSDRDRFLATGYAYVDFARNHPKLFRLMFGRFVSDHRDQPLTDASNAHFTVLRHSVAKALGLDPESESALLGAYNAWAIVHGYSHLMLDGQLGNDMDTQNATIQSALKQWLSLTEATAPVNTDGLDQ